MWKTITSIFYFTILGFSAECKSINKNENEGGFSSLLQKRQVGSWNLANTGSKMGLNYFMKRGATGPVPFSDEDAYNYGIRAVRSSDQYNENETKIKNTQHNNLRHPNNIWYPDRIARSMGTNYFLTKKKRSFDPLGSQLYQSGLDSKFFRKRAFNGPSQIANFMGLDYLMN